MLWHLIKFFASLKLAVTTFTTIALLLIVSTWIAIDPTNGAIRRDFYNSWWFNSLLGILALNIICVVLVRLPHLKIWDIGFVTAHFGVLTILFGAMLSSNFKIYGYMSLREGAETGLIELEDERQLRVTLKKQTFIAPLKEIFDEDANMYEPSEPNKLYHLTGSEYFLKVERFLPNVEEKRVVVESKDSDNSAIEIEFKLNGETQGSSWLFLNEPTSLGPLKVYFEKTDKHLPDNLEFDFMLREIALNTDFG